MPSGLRFGVSFPGAPDAEAWRARARAAEAAGFDTFLMPDHVKPRMLSPFTALAVAAEATTSIRVGTLVLNNDLRHPLVVAREAATLQMLTRGRLELGLGAGHSREEYRQTGLSFDAPKTRVARLGESVELVRSVWAGGTVDFGGAHYDLSGLPCTPVDQPIPILVGGNHPDILAIAASRADIVGFIGVSQSADGRLSTRNFGHEGLERQVRQVREAAGDRFAGLELSVLVQQVRITDQRREAAEVIEREVPGFRAEEVLRSPYMWLGTCRQIRDQIEHLRQTFGIGYFTVLGNSFRAMSEVLAAGVD